MGYWREGFNIGPEVRPGNRTTVGCNCAIRTPHWSTLRPAVHSWTTKLISAYEGVVMTTHVMIWGSTLEFLTGW